MHNLLHTDIPQKGKSESDLVGTIEDMYKMMMSVPDSSLVWRGDVNSMYIMLVCAGMDVLQFRVMARVLEHINKWSTSTLFWAAADQLQTGKDSQPVDPRHLKAQLKRVHFLCHSQFPNPTITFTYNMFMIYTNCMRTYLVNRTEKMHRHFRTILLPGKDAKAHQ